MTFNQYVIQRFGPQVGLERRFSAPVDDIALLRDHGKASIPIHRGYTPIYFPFEDIEYLSGLENIRAPNIPR